MEPIRFGIIGGGWRAEFFLRIAAAAPERFQVTGMTVRDGEKGQAIEARWHVPTFRTAEKLLALPRLAFVVVSVPRSVCPDYLRMLARAGMPALSETPPAPDLPGLVDVWRLVENGAKIQVAEQYQFQPLHAARLEIARQGLLGTVSQAQVSAAHGYHGISLLRLFLGVGHAEATVHARAFTSPIVAGPNRAGPPTEHQIKDSPQTIAQLDFQGKLGVFDFTGDQYFSWIRSGRMLVRGERGEINNSEVRYLVDYQTPVEMSLRRVDAGHDGNLEGYYLKGILAGEKWGYRNPFAPARLTDDEIAIAACLEKMAVYAGGGPEFYSVAEAAQDHYLGLLIDQAVASGEAVRATRQPWA
jgi:predicted dehydrogenase